MDNFEYDEIESCLFNNDTYHVNLRSWYNRTRLLKKKNGYGIQTTFITYCGYQVEDDENEYDIFNDEESDDDYFCE